MSTFNLEQARKRAKELWRAARAGDAEALARLDAAEPKLADAQRVIAREAGFSSWPRLVAHAEAVAVDAAERADRLVAAAIDEHGAKPGPPLLVGHGADLGAHDGSERTPYALAVRIGRPDIAETLVGLGAEPGATALDRFLGACARGDESQAQAVLEAHPGLLDEVERGDRESLVEAVRHGNEAATRLLLALGWPLDVQSELGGTALHFAAWLNQPHLARILIEHGAELEVLADTGSHATPLAWAVHAGHPEPARVLVEAGARVHPAFIDDADDEVRDVLTGLEG